MQQRRGAYALIETMLLIGFIVVSMFAVYSWAKSRAREDTTRVISSIASSLQCADIRIAASCDSGIIFVNNTGLHTIKKMLVRWVAEGQETSQSSFLDTDMKPSGFISSAQHADLALGREVVPVVEIKNKLYLCNEKAITAKC